VEIAEHIAALRREGGLLAGAADGTSMDAAVPTCPGWVLRDLVRHVGMVHRWATVYLGQCRMTVLTEDEEREQLEPAPDGDDRLVDWYRAGHAVLVDALSDAPADLECWHFMPAPSPLAFWARRQAHEAAIHRVDAESASGRLTPFDPAFAVDGIDEMLNGFMPRRVKRLRTERPRSLYLHATDTGDDWLIRLDPRQVRVSNETGPADCAVHATAGELYVLLWNRRSTDGLRVDGDDELLAHWRDNAQVRWS